jgi:hypothetical protein
LRLNHRPSHLLAQAPTEFQHHFFDLRQCRLTRLLIPVQQFVYQHFGLPPQVGSHFGPGAFHRQPPEAGCLYYRQVRPQTEMHLALF